MIILAYGMRNWIELMGSIFNVSFWWAGSKNGPTDWLSSKMGLLTNEPSSSLFTSLAMLAVTWQTSVTFNFVTNDGPGLGCTGLRSMTFDFVMNDGSGFGCTGLRVFYDSKKNVIDCADL